MVYVYNICILCVCVCVYFIRLCLAHCLKNKIKNKIIYGRTWAKFWTRRDEARAGNDIVYYIMYYNNIIYIMNEREPGGHDTVECGWFEKKYK